MLINVITNFIQQLTAQNNTSTYYTTEHLQNIIWTEISKPEAYLKLLLITREIVSFCQNYVYNALRSPSPEQTEDKVAHDRKISKFLILIQHIQLQQRESNTRRFRATSKSQLKTSIHAHTCTHARTHLHQSWLHSLQVNRFVFEGPSLLFAGNIVVGR